MRQQGTPYTGFLYAGLMIAADGTLKLLEYNCRMGDPETQPVIMRLQSDLVDVLDAAIVVICISKLNYSGINVQHSV